MILKHLAKVCKFTKTNNNSLNKTLCNFMFSTNMTTSTQSQLLSTPQLPSLQPHKQQYRDILLKLNLGSVRNEIMQMKKINKSATLKFKKMEMINQLLELQEEKIKNRLKQLQHKTILQLNSKTMYQQDTQPVGKIVNNDNEKSQKQKVMSTKTLQQQERAIHQDQHTAPLYEKYKSGANILKDSLKKLLNRDLFRIYYAQKASNELISDNLYDSWYNSNRENKQKLLQSSEPINSNGIQKKTENQQQHYYGHHKSHSQKHKKILSKQQLQLKQKLYKKPFVNKLFKTNQQLVVEQKKRKYLFQYEKSDIIEQIFQDSPIHLKEFKKTMHQICQQKKENFLMRGFLMKYSTSLYKKYFKDKETILFLYCGFFYYKQLVTTPHLIQFIFALTFDRKLPLEFTILKIVEEYLQCPQTFKYNLKSISKEHYLKFLRASSNYILKVFKRVDMVNVNEGDKKLEDDEKDLNSKLSNHHNGESWQDNGQDNTIDDDDYSQQDEMFRQGKQKLSKKLSEQAQKFPKSKQYIDLQLIRFALAIFQAGIERIIGEIKQKRQFFLQRSLFDNLNITQNEKNQLKETQQTLMLSFEVFKTIQGLFSSIQINDFNDLDKLSHILTSYHNLRRYMATKISFVHEFMRNYDKQYEEKLQLGLGNITTQKQLEIENFILKNQARKLNFDIIDNITSMLKHDNLQITLENKRMNIFGVLERVLNVYIQNNLIDFLEDQLIYNIVRYLQKQVYLDNKIKGLFKARVNFDTMMMEKEKERMQKEKQQQKQQENHQQNQDNSNVRKNSILDTYGMNASDQYDFTNTQFTQQSSQISSQKTSKSTSSPTTFQWFQLQSVYLSQQQPRKQYNFNQLVFQKTQRSQYFMGKISQLLSKQLLYNLIRIIKYKHDRKEISIEQINNFNLIQQWYSQPTVIRLQFLKQEIIERYKRINQQQNSSEKIHSF